MKQRLLVPVLFSKNYRSYTCLKRLYVSKTNTKKNENASMTSSSDLYLYNRNFDAVRSIAGLNPPNSIEYLKSLSKGQLWSLTLISVATLNRSLLNFCIKMFPYVPVSILRLTISKVYCGGETFSEVVDCGKFLQKRGISNMMLSLTIENAEGSKKKPVNIDTIVDETINSIHNVLRPNFLSQLKPDLTNLNDIAPGYIALKPSALVENLNDAMLNFDPSNNENTKQLIANCCRITNEIYQLNKELYKKFPHRKAPFFLTTIDAEKFDLQFNGVYKLQRILFQKYNPTSFPLISCIGTWQLYLKDSETHLKNEMKLAQLGGYKLGVKLVRGAYIHSEPNRSEIIFSDKKETDDNYNNVMIDIINDMCLNTVNSVFGHLVIASHNYQSQLVASIFLKDYYLNNHLNANVIFAQLLGMGDNVTHELINYHNVKNIIKYVPWGPAIETKDYLLRRLQENGDAVRSDNGWPLLKSILMAVVK
ncbi:hypothetical protein KAFR_0H02160 [Kazachstania africana CBS 2517]|uniref:Proline dehydrogenase n=1 Tax=Kazachstania africana (strain ATCC 22294 / BCRC 22015 / CBS 2517 / CECT 1963 / NBRC 1671 / NRRL Y-8276) TaxID=1071382 RepID=H2AZ69_KAZAF|nr:hypothetical protein KAFR_0H02160 [Kazachstania africana CBS 2517]CCF59625.1 hypothetical protein KAFR_0H02160 [Kazachstania africana CBS 2517]